MWWTRRGTWPRRPWSPRWSSSTRRGRNVFPGPRSPGSSGQAASSWKDWCKAHMTRDYIKYTSSNKDQKMRVQNWRKCIHSSFILNVICAPENVFTINNHDICINIGRQCLKENSCFICALLPRCGLQQTVLKRFMALSSFILVSRPASPVFH